MLICPEGITRPFHELPSGFPEDCFNILSSNELLAIMKLPFYTKSNPIYRRRRLVTVSVALGTLVHIDITAFVFKFGGSRERIPGHIIAGKIAD